METKALQDLRQALKAPGCPVCRLVEQDVARYVDYFLWERVNDPNLRRFIREALGFCRDHLRILAAHPGASLSLALIAQDIWEEVLRRTEWAGSPPSPVRRGRAVSAARGQRALTPRGRCPICDYAQGQEDLYLDMLLEGFTGENSLLAAYEASDGLCLPHFRQALTRNAAETALQELLRAQRAIWQRLKADLDEFIRKNDYRFRDEPWGEERDAWLRAWVALVGG